MIKPIQRTNLIGKIHLSFKKHVHISQKLLQFFKSLSLFLWISLWSLIICTCIMHSCFIFYLQIIKLFHWMGFNFFTRRSWIKNCFLGKKIETKHESNNNNSNNNNISMPKKRRQRSSFWIIQKMCHLVKKKHFTWSNILIKSFQWPKSELKKSNLS